MNKIGVIGLGYVGQTMLGALANLGFRVVGMDIDEAKINTMKKSFSPTVYEPGLRETYLRNKHNIEFTSGYKEIVTECEIIVITVGTPWGSDNQPNISGLQIVIDSISPSLRKGHLIILRSTVTPGTTVRIGNELSKKSGLLPEKEFYLAFCPERTIEGIALHELYNLPNIIGGIGPKSAAKTKTFFEKLGNQTILVNSPTDAEVCKLVDNMYRALNIGFANELGNLCEKIGIDSYKIVSAVNSAYSRTTVFRPGLGADGPCLSKDPLILRHFAELVDVDMPIINSSIEVNQLATKRVVSNVLGFLQEKKLFKSRIALLGLAFKGTPETDDLRGAPSVSVYEELCEISESNKEFEFEFSFYDPVITDFMGAPVSRDIRPCLEGANVIIFLNNHPRLRNVSENEIMSSSARPLLVFDSWHNIKEPREITTDSSVSYIRVGDGT